MPTAESVTAPLSPVAVAAVYRGAADLLMAKGWTHHTFEGVNGSLCVTAAINRTARRPDRDQQRDVFEPLTHWLVDNRADEVRAVMRLSGFRPGGEPLAAVLRHDFTVVHMTSAGMLQRWNDTLRDLPDRDVHVDIRDVVVGVLRAAADTLDTPASPAV